MKNHIFIAALLFLAVQSFAIIGIGGHYAPSLGTKLKASKEKIKTFEVNGEKVGDVFYDQKGFSGMQGFGFKLWIDLLPFIDVEATYNIQWGSYNADLIINQGDTEKIQPLEIELSGVPFGKATPKYVAMNGDLSITYPITFIPILRPYVGGGLTYYLNTPILDKKFVSQFMKKSGDLLLNNENGLDPKKSADLATALAKEIAKEGLNKSIGGHLLVGMRAKLPVIPLAAYANAKYYLGGDFHKDIDYGRFVFELGAAFAI